MKIQQILEMRRPPAEGYDRVATHKWVMQIEKALKDKFNVGCESLPAGDSFPPGAVTIKPNNGYFAPEEKAGEGIFTLKAFNAAITPFYNHFRQKEWLFTQPQGGAFTIGVPGGEQ